ncbi:hypothetical protein MTO96_020849 [Rhipicephalus appendiculatus]
MLLSGAPSLRTFSSDELSPRPTAEHLHYCGRSSLLELRQVCCVLELAKKYADGHGSFPKWSTWDRSGPSRRLRALRS